MKRKTRAQARAPDVHRVSFPPGSLTDDDAWALHRLLAALPRTAKRGKPLAPVLIDLTGVTFAAVSLPLRLDRPCRMLIRAGRRVVVVAPLHAVFARFGDDAFPVFREEARAIRSLTS